MANAPGFDQIALIKANVRTIVTIVVVATAAAAIYAFVAPKWYQAELTVVPAPAARGGVPMLGGAGGSISAALDVPFDIGLGASDVDRIAAVLKSISVTDAVIEKFHLIERYHDKHIEDARKELWEHCNIKAEKKQGTVTLTCEDKSPEMAKAIADYFGEYGNKVFRRVSASSASEERRFLENRVAQARKEADDAAKNLREFQEKNKVIDLEEQSKAVVSSMAALKGELLSKQLELSYLDTFSSADESTAVQLKQQISVMEAKLRALEDASNQSSIDPGKVPRRQAAARGKGGVDVFPPAMSMPGLRFELGRLFREQKISETLFLLLTQRYETAKVNEARDTSAFQILDYPTLPTRKSRPKRIVVIAIGTVVGLIASVGWILLPAWWRFNRRFAPPAHV